MKKLVLIMALTAFLTQCLSAQNSPKVLTKGAMKDMVTTYDLKVWLDTLPDKSHLFAMGHLALQQAMHELYPEGILTGQIHEL